MARFFLETLDAYTEAELSSIIVTIHQNNLYQWICGEHNDIVYRALSELAVWNERGHGGHFDGVRILAALFPHKRGSLSSERAWIQTDSEFILMRNILYLVGGVVSLEVYSVY